MDEGLKITISLERFEKLIDVETRAQVLVAETKRSKYNVDRETVATILGFCLPKENEEGRFNE